VIAQEELHCASVRKSWAARHFGINLVLVSIAGKFSKPTTSVSIFLKTAKGCRSGPSFSRLRHKVVLGLRPARRTARGSGWLLVVRRISFRTAANRGHADAVGITEVDLGRGDGLAILHLHQRHAVASPEFPERHSLQQTGRNSAVAVARYRVRGWMAWRGHQDVIASLPECIDPVLRCTCSGIAHQFGSFGGPGGGMRRTT